MCGIYGYIGAHRKPVDLDVLLKIALATEARGPHAFGFAWVDGAGKMHAYKQPGRLSEHPELLNQVRGAIAVIGHTRFATQGDPTTNYNNHPHAMDGGWFVHNGIVYNYDELLDVLDLKPSTECDSEVIGLLAESLAGPLPKRVREAVDMVEGPLAVAALWARPAKMLLVRRGNPLHLTDPTAKQVWFASRPEAIPMPSTEITAGRVTTLAIAKSGKIHIESTPPVAPEPKPRYTKLGKQGWTEMTMDQYLGRDTQSAWLDADLNAIKKWRSEQNKRAPGLRGRAIQKAAEELPV